MLAPRDTPTRERKSFDGLCRFALDAEAVGRKEDWWSRPLTAARDISVPAGYNGVFADAAVRDRVGDAWYQTLARVPARWAGERIVLRFGSATHRAVLWVNDTQVAEHEGGYTRFEADVTGVVQLGAENRAMVVVNNVLTWLPRPSSCGPTATRRASLHPRPPPHGRRRPSARPAGEDCSERGRHR
jgi:beta-glucuronidase